MKMTTPDSERQFWLDFIGRINDRIISRRRSTGVTLWAILIALAYLIYSIIDRFAILAQNTELFDLFLLSFASVSNILLALFVFFTLYFFRSAPPTKDIRLLSPLRRISYQNVAGMVIFLMLCAAAFNIYIYTYSSGYSIAKWPYLLFGAFLSIQVIGQFIKDIRNRFQLGHFYSEAPHIIDAETFTSDVGKRRFVLIFLLIVGTGLLIVASLSIISILNNSTLSSNLDIIKLSLEISALISLTILSLGMLAGMHQHQYLEDLERKIVIDNMEVKDIRYAFIREYLGESTRDFINETELKINQYHEKCLRIIEECSKDLKSMGDIDQQYTYEIAQRRRNTCEKVTKAMKEYVGFIEQKVSHIGYLDGKDAFSADEELLKHIMGNWHDMNKEVINSYKLLCEECLSVHPGIGLDKCNKPHDGLN